MNKLRHLSALVDTASAVAGLPKVASPADLTDYLKSIHSLPSLSFILLLISGGFLPSISSFKDPMSQVTPWYSVYRDNYLKGFAMSDHEYFEHPVACLIIPLLPFHLILFSIEYIFFYFLLLAGVVVISSANLDPLNTLLKLYQQNAPPPALNKPYIDPNILKYYLILHDGSSGKMDE